LTLYLLAYSLGAPVDLDDLRRIPENVAAALSLEEEIAQHAERYTFMGHAVSIARGLNYANAFEFALKLMETCYVIAERFSSADLLHGPIAMLESSFPAFLFTPAGVTWPAMQEMVKKLESLKADSLAITDQSNSEVRDVRTITIPVSLAHDGLLPVELYTPIPYIVPGQLFAAHLASHKGLDPDRPRTLSKVTRTL
jgi:glucosamine--fructose-6-phosphate aminotransferase (isomerizing)